MTVDHMLKLLQIAELSQKLNLSGIHNEAIRLIDEEHRKAHAPKEPAPEDEPFIEDDEPAPKPAARRF